MRKQELVHLHGLLAEVRRYCEREDGRSIDRSEYESLGTDETSIHRGKDQHRLAVSSLAEAITEALDEDQVVLTSPN